MAKDKPKPFPSPFVRVARDLIAFFFIIPSNIIGSGLLAAKRWIWGAPLWMKLLAVAIILVGIGGVAYWYKSRVAYFAAQDINKDWAEFTTSAIAVETDKLKEILNRILQKDPNNELAKNRLIMINKGEAPPEDKEMLRLIIRIHIKNNALDLSVRESKKLLTVEPSDWFANCILAQDAINRQDRQAIDQYLGVINDPFRTSAVDASTVLYSFHLHQVSNRDTTKIRAFVISKIIPMMKNQNVATMKMNQRIQIITCYMQTVQSASETTMPELLGYWSWCSSLMNNTLATCIESKDITTLKQLIPINNNFNYLLSRFRLAKQLDAEESAPLTKEIDDRTLKIWTTYKELEPENSEPYAGLALYELKKQNVAKATEYLQEGLKYPPTMGFFVAKAEWAKQTNQSGQLLKELEKYLQRLPDNVALLKLFAETAVAAQRRDLAIEAIQKMAKLGNNSPTLKWAEAGLWMEAGKAETALALLKEIPETDLIKYANLAKAYSQALAEMNEETKLMEFIKKVDETAERAKDPELALAPIQGLLDATNTLKRLDKVSELADRVQQRWPHYLPAIKTRADAMARASEMTTPRWEPGRVRTTLDILESFKSRDPGDLWGFGQSAWLRLKGQNSVELAWRESEPLRAAEQNRTLNDENLVILGAIYLAKHQYDDAIRCLTLGARTVRHPSVAYIHLALAYRGKGDMRNARMSLGQAQSFLRSDQERDDYKATALLLQE